MPSYPGRPGVVAIKDMFDMVAGTSTGSIISAALSCPKEGQENVEFAKKEPKFFMKEVMEVYTTKGEQIFAKNEAITWWGQLIAFLACMIVFGISFYCLGKKCFDSDKQMEEYEHVEETLRELKACGNHMCNHIDHDVAHRCLGDDYTNILLN